MPKMDYKWSELMAAIRSRLGPERHEGEYDDLLQTAGDRHQEGQLPSSTVEAAIDALGITRPILVNWREQLQEQGKCW